MGTAVLWTGADGPEQCRVRRVWVTSHKGAAPGERSHHTDTHSWEEQGRLDAAAQPTDARPFPPSRFGRLSPSRAAGSESLMSIPVTGIVRTLTSQGTRPSSCDSEHVRRCGAPASLKPDETTEEHQGQMLLLSMVTPACLLSCGCSPPHVTALLDLARKFHPHDCTR